MNLYSIVVKTLEGADVSNMFVVGEEESVSKFFGKKDLEAGHEATLFKMQIVERRVRTG